MYRHEKMQTLNKLYALLLWQIVIFALVLPGHLHAENAKVTCRDEAGEPVDWFYVYKLPKHWSSGQLTQPRDLTGHRYLYITSRNYDAWQLSTRHINESDSITALTLQPIFSDDSVLLVGYNDEFPNGTFVATGGHTKGILASDGKTGMWLIHSVPKFSAIPRYEYPHTASIYGQSALCLTLPATEVDKVGQQLIFNEPNIYYTRLPAALNSRFPHVEAALERKWRTSPPYQNMLEIKTLDGDNFRSFAKSGRFHQDLYEDWLAPELDINLLVETWRNGGGNMPSNCSRSEKVFNVAEVYLKPLEVSFESTSDHSKWAVSIATGFKLWRWRIGGADWICVGDINRQDHQKQRGGGTVCQKNAKVTKLYRDLIGSYDPCHEWKM